MRVLSEEKLNNMLAYIREYAHDHNGDIPALSKIMEKTGMVKSVAFRYIMTLRDRGLIEYTGKGTLRLAEDLTYYRKYESVKVPIYGSVRSQRAGCHRLGAQRVRRFGDNGDTRQRGTA